MANQYFENNENLSSNISEIMFHIKGKTLVFFSDNGVFSKNQIDLGTRNLIKYLNVSNAKTILDVGCGYGVIGTTIAKFNPNTYVKMVDINERAIGLARENLIKNDVNNAEIFVSNIYDNIFEKFDLIVTNPPIRAGKSVVHSICVDGIKHLNDGGSLWCVLMKKHGALSLIKKMKEVYSSVETVDIVDEYYIICGKK